MKMTLSLDLKLFMASIVLMLCVVLLFGDAMFVGLWYYVAVPVAAALLVWPFKPRPLFLFGVSIGLDITFAVYLCINYFSNQPEGLLGLGHLFSLPGAALGLIICAFLMRRGFGTTIWAALLLGIVGTLLGFIINQLVVCNTVMWCGPLTVAV
ncbi:hypothetical protein [Rheinheimera soli]|uniref:hypothetical protein n=1 Tax=Rheinheimera soli TaxID=443616 RepID=UPI001E490EB5|nr:hypothetical protein [Rheinheimera soli]